MTTKYTKGPWDFDEVIWKTRAFENIETYDVYSDDGQSIAIMMGDKEDFKANAKLIAAAPDLLEACINSLEMCRDSVMPTEQDLQSMQFILENVIKKATL